MNLGHPNGALGVRGTAHGSHEQPLVQGTEVESAVEAVGKSGEISCGISSEVERVATPVQAGFEVVEHGVDPLELKRGARPRRARTALGVVRLQPAASRPSQVRKRFLTGFDERRHATAYCAAQAFLPRIDNQPYLRCLHGTGLCLWRLGKRA